MKDIQDYLKMSKKKIAIIIPYQDTNDERFSLLLLCLDQFKIVKEYVDIFLHEMGERKTADLLKVTGYKFTKNFKHFKKGWCINSIFREYILDSKLYSKVVIFDTDIISENPNVLIKGISSIENGQPWNSLIWLPLEITKHILYKYSNLVPYSYLIKSIENNLSNDVKTNEASMDNLAGGIQVISIKVFEQIKGIPEFFDGSWGGEDNAFWLKLTSLGYTYENYLNKVYHLFHQSRSPFIEKKYSQLHDIKRWTKKDWLEHLNLIDDNWGKNG